MAVTRKHIVQVTLSTVTATSATGMVMASVNELADRAKVLWSPPGSNTDKYALWIMEGFKRLVADCGGFYIGAYELSLEPGVCEYLLPDDWRKPKPYGIALYYSPRTITTASRASNVLTITTSEAHNLTVGATVALADVTYAGDTAIDGNVEVASVVSTTVFTAAQTGEDGAGTGGAVASQYEDETFLAYAEEASVTGMAEWSRTEDRPSSYFFPDARHIAFNYVPDGADPAVTLRYDGRCPSTLTMDDDLPGADDMEEGLIGYGHYKQAKVLGDNRMAQLGLADYSDAKQRWLRQVARAKNFESFAALLDGADIENDINDPTV